MEKFGSDSRVEQKLTRLGTLRSGEVVYDRPRSHISSDHEVMKYLEEALSKIEMGEKDFLVETVDFGEVIGGSKCVETTREDEIVFAQRVGRKGPTRFVRGREPEPTSKFTVILMRADEGCLLITAFIGDKAEPEPWDRQATSASFEFWSNHALVWDGKDIVPDTEVEE